MSVHRVPLDGRTARVADAVPGHALLRCLIEALRFVDEGAPAAPDVPRERVLRLVHSVGADPRSPALSTTQGTWTAGHRP